MMPVGAQPSYGRCLKGLQGAAGPGGPQWVPGHTADLTRSISDPWFLSSGPRLPLGHGSRPLGPPASTLAFLSTPGY